MKLLTYAIASIIDANTGYGLPRIGQQPDYSQAINRGHEIRAKSVVALWRQFKAAITGLPARGRNAIKRRREIKTLLNLSDRLLDDIGLTRADVVAVHFGQISLQQLRDIRTRALHSTGKVRSRQHRFTAPASSRMAVNEAVFAKAKCA